MADLALVCTITAPGGTLDLEAAPYALERGAFEEAQVSWRKQEATSPWVEGTFITHAVRENITRPLNVWVSAATDAALETAISELTDALEQLSFTITFGVTGSTTTWRCQMADYSIRREQGHRVAKTALVSAQVPTKPTPVTA